MRARPLPRYPYTLDEPLLWLTSKDPWTIRMACEGTQILGDMGSGKTSGSGQALALAFLRAGFGGLILTKKTDECARWISYVKAAGRQQSLLVVHPREPWRFNVLDYQFSRDGEGAGYTQNAVNLFMNIIENRRQGGGTRAKAREDFWEDNVRRLVHYALETLRVAEEPITMDHLNQVVQSLPYPNPQTGQRMWPQDSYTQQCLQKAIFRYEKGLVRDPVTSTDPRAIKSYFEDEFARPGTDRQSAGILSTFTGMAQPFLMAGPVKELFCTTTTFLPEFSCRGAVIILNLPTDEWEEIGRTAQLAFKYIWQRTLLRRQGLGPGETPVFLWADEAQTFTTEMDRAFQEAARSSVACTVYLTQNINNYIAAFGGETAKAQTYGLLAGLGTKIFHRNGDHETNQWAADVIAKNDVLRYSGGTSSSRGWSISDSQGSTGGYTSSSQGGSSSGGWTTGNSASKSDQYGTNEGWREEQDYEVPPGTFTRLAAGGPRARHQVQGIVFKSGEAFSTTGKPYTGVIFSQR